MVEIATQEGGEHFLLCASKSPTILVIKQYECLLNSSKVSYWQVFSWDKGSYLQILATYAAVISAIISQIICRIIGIAGQDEPPLAFEPPIGQSLGHQLDVPVFRTPQT